MEGSSSGAAGMTWRRSVAAGRKLAAGRAGSDSFGTCTDSCLERPNFAG